MAKPPVYLIVGLPHCGVPALVDALETHRADLADAGVCLPSTSADEMFRAAVELRREHRAWGLRRKDVEGSWARIARRIPRKPSPASTVLGHDLLAGADRDEIALLVDALAGTAVHVVVIAAAPDALAGLVPAELDLADVLARWESAVKSPDRVHVVLVDPADPAGPATAWTALATLVGFDAERLPLPVATDAPALLDAGTLRLLAESTTALLDDDELVELAEHWAKMIADGGYDVCGDPGALVPARGTRPTDPSRATEPARVDVLRASLGDAVTEVGRLREQVAALEAQVSAAARRPRRRFGS